MAGFPRTGRITEIGPDRELAGSGSLFSFEMLAEGPDCQKKIGIQSPLPKAGKEDRQQDAERPIT